MERPKSHGQPGITHFGIKPCGVHEQRKAATYHYEQRHQQIIRDGVIAKREPDNHLLDYSPDGYSRGY